MARTVIILAAITMLLGSVREVKANFIVNQRPADPGVDVISQVFPNQSASSTFAFDDFTTTQAYSLTNLTVLGTERGDATQNVAVTAEIWSGLPGTGSLVHAFSGSEDNNGTLNFDLGNYMLSAGSYWLTAYVTRPVIPSGLDQWFIDLYRPVTGSQAYLYNPGDGFGNGTDPFPIAGFAGLPAEDLAFALSGDVLTTPEPPSLALAAIGAITVGCYTLQHRRRRILDSICQQ